MPDKDCLIAQAQEYLNLSREEECQNYESGLQAATKKEEDERIVAEAAWMGMERVNKLERLQQERIFPPLLICPESPPPMPASTSSQHLLILLLEIMKVRIGFFYFLL